MKKFIAIFLIFQLNSCFILKNNENKIHTKNILGVWRSKEKQSKHPSLNFGPDSLVSVGSNIDTVYWFKYFLKNRYLILRSGSEVIKNKILKLDSDSLVFESIFKIPSRQSYFRRD